MIGLVRGIRNLRAELNLAPKQKTNSSILTANASGKELIEANLAMVCTLSNSANIELLSGADARPSHALSQRVGELEVYLPFPEDYNSEAEVKRLQNELKEGKEYLDRLAAKLANPNSAEKAKPEVVTKERERLAEQQVKVTKVEERLALFQGGAR